ncbi:PAS domain-containing protein, partial [Geodermatophilus chilensis]|uniref:PAS domain-containing protein n=1 Tax=Geodermatophilus chilensis TaxID=2035835 RepID=UPI0018E4058F
RAGWAGTIDAFTERLHPDDAARTLGALRHAIDTCGEYDAEFRVVLPTGETRWVQAGAGRWPARAGPPSVSWGRGTTRPSTATPMPGWRGCSSR